MNPADFGAPPASACTQGTGGADRITRNIYNVANERVQLREGVGTSIEAAEATWAYNLNGQVTTVIDGNGNRAVLRYDGHGRQDRWTFPSTDRPSAYNDATQATALDSAGAVNAADYEEYSYDPNGNRTNLRKRDERNIAFVYDALNRATSKTYPQGGATAVYYSYDLRGLQLSARFTSQSGEGITSAWDGFGRLASSSTNMGGTTRTLSYTYDLNGNRIRITHPDGVYFTATYDGLSRQTWIHEQGVNGRVVAGYNHWGSFAGTSRSNLTLTNYGYDAVQRPNAYHHDLGGTASDGLWLFDRNPAGQIGSVTRYNDAYAWTGAYTVNRPHTTNGLNQYARTGQPNAAGSVQFTYDANGNLASEAIWNGTAYIVSTTYTYDVENRLVGRSGGVTLAYDPLGRLFSVASPSTYTRFLYDGAALVAEYDGAGVLSRRYVHWTGADVPMLSYAGTALTQLSQLHADERGSIIAATDAAGAATINAYDEYGIPGVGNGGRFQYTGQIWLPELGMYYYKARVYSPTLGRFLQTDPIGYEDQFNLYAYVGNDPVNYLDPNGADSIPTPRGIQIRPIRPEVPTVTIPSISGVRGVNYWRQTLAHLYIIPDPSRIPNPQQVGDRLANTPAPGPASMAATPQGTRNNVGHLVPLDNNDNYVMSYRVPSPDPRRFTDVVVNYTIPGEHALEEGFVMRYGVIDGGRVTDIVTYSEGNSGLQDPILQEIWLPQVRDTWRALNRRLGL